MPKGLRILVWIVAVGAAFVVVACGANYVSSFIADKYIWTERMQAEDQAMRDFNQLAAEVQASLSVLRERDRRAGEIDAERRNEAALARGKRRARCAAEASATPWAVSADCSPDPSRAAFEINWAARH